MKFETACKKAMNYFSKEYGDAGLASIKDLGDKWLFDGANEDSSVVYGKQCITIDKDTGEREIFIFQMKRISNFLRMPLILLFQKNIK